MGVQGDLRVVRRLGRKGEAGRLLGELTTRESAPMQLLDCAGCGGGAGEGDRGSSGWGTSGKANEKGPRESPGDRGARNVWAIP